MTKVESPAVAVRKGKKRVSKKKKTAWRKHCSTKDVDSFLDELRHEERVGVHFNIVEDDKLFFVDTTSGDVQEKVKSNAERKLEAKKKLAGVPKCFEALLPHTSVPDPINKRNRVRTPEERKHPIKKKIEADRKVQGILTTKEKDAAKNRDLCEIKKINKPKPGEFSKDLWNEVPKETSEVDLQWLNPTTYRHVCNNTRQMQKKVPVSVTSKTSVLPAIEAPHPGTSYNPSFLDHRTLLIDVVQNEKKLIKEEKHLLRVTSEMFSKVTPEENDSLWAKEILQGLPQSDEVTIKEEEDHENSEYKAVNPPSKDKKKTRKQKRNLRLAKEEDHQRKLKAIEKKKVADIYKLKKIVQNVENNEEKSLQKQALLQKKKELKKLQAKRLSRVKYEELEPDFNMPYDLSGNLRALKTEGNILRDRFKSLQKRNILQPTVLHRSRKKGNKKAFIKGSHK